MSRARDIADLQSGAVAFSSTISLTDSDVAHGMTGLLPTATYGQLATESGTEGGVRITTATEGATAYSVTATSTTPSTDGNGAVFRFRASKKSGTSEQALADTDDLMTIGNVGVEKVFIQGSGNVGINASPISYANAQATLFLQDDANPAIGISDTGQSKDYFIVANGSRLGVVYGDGSNSSSASNVTEIASFNNSGFVGLGTDSPQRQLVLYKNDSGQTQIQFQNQTTGTGSSDGFGVGLDTQEDGFLWNYEGGDIYFGRASTRFMTLEGSSGNLCVNDTTARLPNGNTVSIAGDNSTHGLSVVRYNSSYGAYAINIGRSKNNTVGGNTALANNDVIGYVTWYANDGTDTNSIAAQIEARIDGTVAGNNVPGELVFRTSADGHGGGAGSEKMVIDSGGNVFFGATSTSAPSFYFAPDSGGGSMQSNKDSTNTRNAMVFINPNGTVGTISISGSATSFNTSSDYRLKENVVTDWDATSRLKQLKPSRFNFKADKDTIVDGFLAHEVSSIVPEAVTGEKDATEKYTDEDGVEKTRDVYQGIDQSKLVPLLVKTIQELEARIAKLEGD